MPDRRPVHLLEAGIVTEQRFMGVAEAPAALGLAFAARLQPEKRVRVPFNPRDRWLTAAREACIILSDAVGTSLKSGARVAILGGECTLVAGSLSGALAVEPEMLLLYFDAHGDYNTVATTPSHFLGGMWLPPSRGPAPARGGIASRAAAGGSTRGRGWGRCGASRCGCTWTSTSSTRASCPRSRCRWRVGRRSRPSRRSSRRWRRSPTSAGSRSVAMTPARTPGRSSPG